MNTSEVLVTVITMGVFMFGSILALIWYLGGRIDRLDDRVGARLDRLEASIGHLAEDVTVLKATR